MLLRQMKYFAAVVDCNSFTEAAHQCYISQSAISQQIQALEKELGVELIRRENRRFAVTPAGQYFYTHCKAILEQVSDLIRETKRLSSDDKPQLRIGYLRNYSGLELHQAIAEFSGVFPEISLQNPLSRNEKVQLEELRRLPCILISSREQRIAEQEYYQNTLGFGSSYLFADNLEEGRMLVVGNRGFLPVESVGTLPPEGAAIRRLPVYQGDKQLMRNYCAFWRKEQSNYYIEQFAGMLHELLKQGK